MPAGALEALAAERGRCRRQLQKLLQAVSGVSGASFWGLRLVRVQGFRFWRFGVWVAVAYRALDRSLERNSEWGSFMLLETFTGPCSDTFNKSETTATLRFVVAAGAL